MTKKGGRTTVKRQLAPTFWNINRKEGRFIPRIHPGSHSHKYAYPLGTILRDVLKVAKTMHEAKKIVDLGKVKIDNIIRYNVNFAIGLMDTIELIPSQQYYRFVPKNSLLLYPIEITEDEKALKLVKIKAKNIVKGNKIQYSFHDGKTILSDRNYSVGDTCLIKLPEIEIIQHIKLEKDCLAILTRGDNAGKIGKIQEIKDGTFALPRRVVILIESRILEIPIDMIMVINESNENNPKLKVS
ncbi:MAG TPA: 30S ribosomal protein S4e [Nitrososphaeraceae archaeon]|nr:30S ribosomal protein S4e [Nitrososphaeraceae archaeon]